MSDSENRTANNGHLPWSIQMPNKSRTLEEYKNVKHFEAKWWLFEFEKMTRKATYNCFGSFTPFGGITVMPYSRTIDIQPVTSSCGAAGSSVVGRDHTSSAQLKTSTWAIDDVCFRSLETDRKTGWIWCIPLNWKERPCCWGPFPFERFVSVTRKCNNKMKLLVPCPWVSFVQLNAALLVLHPMYHISYEIGCQNICQNSLQPVLYILVQISGFLPSQLQLSSHHRFKISASLFTITFPKEKYRSWKIPGQASNHWQLP
jgi:hypothetical protein